MKKNLLFAILLSGIVFKASAQCTPDMNYTPTSPTGAGVSQLPCAKLNAPYEGVATVVVPTYYEIVAGAGAYICKASVNSVNNIPAGTNIQYPIYKGGQSYGLGQQIPLNTANPSDRACILLTGTFTAPFNDSLVVNATAFLYTSAACTTPFSLFPSLSVDLKMYFNVSDTCSTGTGLENGLSNNSFDVMQNYPNPVTGATQIAFNAPYSGKVQFKLTNMVGQIIDQKIIAATEGKNYLNVNAKDLPGGIYMYSLTFNGKTVTKRMLVAEK
jgi:hypothetical protein